MSQPLVPVLPGAQMRAWPKHEKGALARYVSIGEALNSCHSTDAHFACYSAPSITRRLDYGALSRTDVSMVVACFDVDGHNVPDVDAWWLSEIAKVESLRLAHRDVLVYRTRGGYRIVGLLREPFELRSKEDAESVWTPQYCAWLAYLQRRFGIVADPSCKEWNRLYRLPHATREEGGRPEQREVIGDVRAIGPWCPDLSEADHAAAKLMARRRSQKPRHIARHATEVPQFAGNGVLYEVLKARGHIGHEIEPGKIAIVCPCAEEHTMGADFDGSTVLYLPTGGDSLGWINCFHGTGGHSEFTVKDWIARFPQTELDEARVRMGFTVRKARVAHKTMPQDNVADIRVAREKRAAHAPPEGRAELICSADSSRPVRHVENAIRVLRDDARWSGTLGLNEFSQEIVFLREPGATDFTGRAKGTRWRESDQTRAAAWMLREYDLGIGSTVALDAAVVVSEAHRFHPVRDYLDGLTWDGQHRIGSWLTKYCHAEQSDITNQVGTWWLISAVARIYQPGCQADHMLVLQGPQGAGKSTALKILGGEWYKSDVADIETKDGPIGLFGKWIVEVAELSSLRGKALETVKSFLTRPSDHVRLPYGKLNTEHPRQCIFAGTTNDATYLYDATGSRRFWPVSVMGIDRDTLSRDRNQIWAEAVFEFKEGRPWWPTDAHQQAQLEEETDKRRSRDPWEETIGDWLGRLAMVGKTEPVTVSQILREAIGKEPSRQDRADEMRVAKCMAALKYERRRARKANSDGKRPWGYVLEGTADE